MLSTINGRQVQVDPRQLMAGYEPLEDRVYVLPDPGSPAIEHDAKGRVRVTAGGAGLVDEKGAEIAWLPATVAQETFQQIVQGTVLAAGRFFVVEGSIAPMDLNPGDAVLHSLFGVSRYTLTTTWGQFEVKSMRHKDVFCKLPTPAGNGNGDGEPAEREALVAAAIDDTNEGRRKQPKGGRRNGRAR